MSEGARQLHHGVRRRQLVLVPPLCSITAIRAVGVFPYRLDLNRPPKKVRCDFLGLDRIDRPGDELAVMADVHRPLLTVGDKGKAGNAADALTGMLRGVPGAVRRGVCFVFPSTFAGLAPAEETATTPINAADIAAKARARRARPDGRLSIRSFRAFCPQHPRRDLARGPVNSSPTVGRAAA